jgi:hypothetical protein
VTRGVHTGFSFTYATALKSQEESTENTDDGGEVQDVSTGGPENAYSLDLLRTAHLLQTHHTH